METLLSFYWQPNDDERVRTAALAGWLEDLADFPEWAIMESLSDWRRNETHRPTPAHIRAKCIVLTGEVHGAIAKAEAEPEPAPRIPPEDEKARVSAVVQDFLRPRRFGVQKAKTHDGAA